MLIIEAAIYKRPTIFTDSLKPFYGLSGYDYKHHYRIGNADNNFALGHNHIECLMNFMQA